MPLLSFAAHVGDECPQGRDWPCVEPVAERQRRLPARVEHDADRKLIADAAGQSLDAAEILGSHGLGCLDLARTTRPDRGRSTGRRGAVVGGGPIYTERGRAGGIRTSAQSWPTSIARLSALLLNYPAPGFTLTSQYGKTVLLSSLRRKVLLSFINPACQIISCPAIGPEFRQATQMIGGIRGKLAGVVLSPADRPVSARPAGRPEPGARLDVPDRNVGRGPAGRAQVRDGLPGPDLPDRLGRARPTSVPDRCRGHRFLVRGAVRRRARQPVGSA